MAAETQKKSLWQDKVISIGQWLFLAALLPSVLGPDKPAFWSSMMTASILGVFAYTFWTLKLKNATISSVAVSVGWFILAYQQGFSGWPTLPF
ncbi:MAG: hypothetical protein HY455_02445 [Parcubacteria group bacterium]|nr:hypothetical protein [Parcubacteria group bacterium]